MTMMIPIFHKEKKLVGMDTIVFMPTNFFTSQFWKSHAGPHTSKLSWILDLIFQDGDLPSCMWTLVRKFDFSLSFSDDIVKPAG